MGLKMAELPALPKRFMANSGNPKRLMGLNRGSIIPKGDRSRKIYRKLYNWLMFADHSPESIVVNKLPFCCKNLFFKLAINQAVCSDI